jgi:hypothetical protein
MRSLDYTRHNSVEMALGPDSTLRVTVFKDGEPAAKWSLSEDGEFFEKITKKSP